MDNGVYILETKERGHNKAQLRVATVDAIETLFDKTGEYIPERVYKTFGNCKITSDYNLAIRIARKIDEEKNTEYGICILPIYKKPWETIIPNK